METAVITVISISNHLSAGSEFNQNDTYTGIIPVYIPHCPAVWAPHGVSPHPLAVVGSDRTRPEWI